jgi:glycosyltransferase involved in cell wall biosynthesis
MLHSMRGVRPPSEGWRIIAVDSASSDHTRALLEASTDLPLTVLAADALGKNRALNIALDHAQEALSAHAIIVFTDDDMRAGPDWLLELEAAVLKAPEADVFGGRIDPVFPQAPARALRALLDRHEVLFARNIRSEGPCPATSVFGPNMAVRTRCITSTTRFDEGMGPDGGPHFPMGSETEFLRRLERAGARAWHAPNARVQHLIRREEMCAAAIIQRAYRHGAGFAQMVGPEQQRRLLGAPLWMWRGCVAETARLAIARLFGDEAARLRARYHHAWFSGAVAQAQRASAKRVPSG